MDLAGISFSDFENYLFENVAIFGEVQFLAKNRLFAKIAKLNTSALVISTP